MSSKLQKLLEQDDVQEEVGTKWETEFRRLEAELNQLLALLEVSDLESARVKIGRLKKLADSREPADVNSALQLIREKIEELDLPQEEGLLATLDVLGQLFQAAESTDGMEDLLHRVKAQVGATDGSPRPGLEVELPARESEIPDWLKSATKIEYVVCRNCGKPNEADLEYCWNCSTSLRPDADLKGKALELKDAPTALSTVPRPTAPTSAPGPTSVAPKKGRRDRIG